MGTSIFVLIIISLEVLILSSSRGNTFGGLRHLDGFPSLFGLQHGEKYSLVII